jgi:hypothetical protein
VTTAPLALDEPFVFEDLEAAADGVVVDPEVRSQLAERGSSSPGES